MSNIPEGTPPTEGEPPEPNIPGGILAGLGAVASSYGASRMAVRTVQEVNAAMDGNNSIVDGLIFGGVTVGLAAAAGLAAWVAIRKIAP
jgi:hypothetical protein